jgi:hypothetical protein
MQDSLTSKLLSASWDAIAASVTTQLARGGVASALRVESTAIDEPASWTWHDLPSPGARTRFAHELDEVRGLSLKVDSRYRLGLDDLRHPNLEHVKRWTCEVRQFELTKILDTLSAVASQCPATVTDLQAKLPAGSGITLLYWKPVLPKIDALESTSWGKPKLLDASPDAPSTARGVLVCDDGGPVVRRDPDLELDWLPVADGVELMLSGRLQLRNVSPATVTVVVDV